MRVNIVYPLYLRDKKGLEMRGLRVFVLACTLMSSQLIGASGYFVRFARGENKNKNPIGGTLHRGVSSIGTHALKRALQTRCAPVSLDIAERLGHIRCVINFWYKLVQ